jgi:glycosyltransferase involved in cell wall biosynthesis
MKIMQINCVYNRGSTGKILHDLHEGLLEHGIDSVVCYGRGQNSHETNVYKTSTEIFAKFNAFRSRITGLQYNGSLIATCKLLYIIKKDKPDIVHLHCINGYFVNIYRLFNFLKRNKIKTVLTLHAEFMFTGSCGHAFDCEKWKSGCGNCPQLWNATKSYFFDRTHCAYMKMKKSFNNFDTLKIISVSKWLEDRAKQSPIMNDHDFDVIKNGIDTDSVFHYREYQYLKERHNLKNEKVLLHVTASFSLHEDDIKGGRYIVALAERLKNKNIVIIVVGGTDLSLVLPDNIINVGRTNNQIELAAYYSMADLAILTSKRETFSMICAEALSCGTPIVGFKAGAPETISLEDYSEFVEYGNIELLEDAVIRWIDNKDNFHKDILHQVKDYYSKKKMCDDYISIYNEMISKN